MNPTATAGDRVVRPTTRPLRAPEALPVPMRVRRAVTLLLLTLVAPGSAQVVAGRRSWGRWAVRVWLALLAVLVLLGTIFLISREAVVWLVARPLVLWTAALVCFVLALAWPLLIVDAWRLGRVRLLPRRARQGLAALTAVLVLATMLPLLATGKRVWAAADLISDVFAGGGSDVAVDGRINVLLLGGDAGPDRVGLRPDSITLASIDADTGRTVLFSLPRNLENVPFPAGSPAAQALPQGWSCGDACLLNAIYTWGSAHRKLFPGAPDPGAEAMKEAVQGVLGLPVNYYVLIDLRGFQSLVDALGGVRLTVGQRVPIGGGTTAVKKWIEPGTRVLDGYHALWFARSRHGASDYARMARQRCVMSAMLQQMDPGTVLSRFQAIASAGKQVVSTDVPASQLSTLLGLATKARSQKVASVQFVPPLIRPAKPDLALIKSRVEQALKPATATAAPAAGSTTSSAGPASPSAASAARPSSSAAPSASPQAATDDIGQICSA